MGKFNKDDFTDIVESSGIKENILNWYEFKENSDILEVNNANIEEVLNIDKTYDYIILSEIVELDKFFSKVHNLLKLDGKLLIVINNKFGMKHWAKGFQEINEPVFSKSETEKMIRKAGFSEIKSYYPLPDYKLTNVIFTDEYLPNKYNIFRGFTYRYRT